jgi:hypothetical protein
MRSALNQWKTFCIRTPFAATLLAFLVGVAVEHGGTKPPKPPTVEEQGIKITRHEVTPQGVSLAWNTEDPRITAETEYIVEFRKRPIMLGDTEVVTPDDFKWKELGRTKSSELLREIYMLDSTFEMRVRADVTGTEVTE